MKILKRIYSNTGVDRLDYKIIVVNGEEEEEIIIVDVEEVKLSDDAYSFMGKQKELLFSSPTDTVKYIIKLK